MASKNFLERTMVPTESTKVMNSAMLSGKRYNKETGAPFDITQYKGAARPGGLPSLTHRREEEELAFCNHVHTARQAPHMFIRKGEGLGGRSNAARAAEVKEQKKKVAIAPILHKVSAASPTPPCRTAAPCTAPLTPRACTHHLKHRNFPSRCAARARAL